MVEAIAATGVAVSSATAGKAVFDYNRENFLYDRDMRMETEYQIMELKIDRAKLFRDDVKEIIGLTSSKMDTYLLINAVQLGWCIMLFCEGRLVTGTPNWIIAAHTLALAGAFTYLLTSVWLSMYAMVAAKSYEVRLLTELVRLPIPSWAQLEGARTYASTFEKVEARQMFRVPFAMGTQESLIGNSHGSIAATALTHEEGGDAQRVRVGSEPEVSLRLDPSERSIGGAESNTDSCPCSADPWGLESPGDSIYELDGAVQSDPRYLQHVQLVNEAMQYWQSYDAFARVTMSIGANQQATALCFYVLGYVLVSNHAIAAAWISVVLLVAIACALIRLDMSLSATEYKIGTCLVLLPPCCIAICARSWSIHGVTLLIQILVPIAFAAEAAWLVFMLHISKVEKLPNGFAVPTGFRSVLFIDVFGWVNDKCIHRLFGDGSANSVGSRNFVGPLEGAESANGSGPAVQSVRYKDGQPIPVRVDQLPGAGRRTRAAMVSKAHFAPATFVAREKDSLEDLDARETMEADKSVARPWRIFCGATSLLATLWCVCGVLTTMEVMGWKLLAVHPLLQASQGELNEPLSQRHEHQSHHNNSALQFGRHMQTQWPRENVRAFGLACDSASDTLVASSRFGLYIADLSAEAPNAFVQFKAAPVCAGTEGETLQDVALHCDPRSSQIPCQAVVLHQHGHRLVKCDIGEQKLALNEVPHEPEVDSVTQDWLYDGDTVATTEAERVQSLTYFPHCASGPRGCAYVGTSGERIMELHQSVGVEGEHHSWFPHRVLQVPVNVSDSGSMAVIQKKFLAVLQNGGKQVRVLDLERGGALVNSWNIPTTSEHGTWTARAMCAAGENIYFLSAGPSPQVWRFPVPSQLKSTELSAAQPTEAESTQAVFARKVGASHSLLSASSTLQHQTEARALRR